MNGLCTFQRPADADPVFSDLLARLGGDGGAAVAVYAGPGQADRVPRRQLVADIEALSGAVTAADRDGSDHHSAWIACRDRYLFVTAALGCLRSGPVALAETGGPSSALDAMAAACPPAVLVTDDATTDAARWAVARDIPVRMVARPDAGWLPPARVTGAPGPEPALQFFTSGTAGPVKCVTIRKPQLLAAITGVAARLRLTERDISLSVAPLSHTLGFITSVLAALGSGGGVSFADPLRPRGLQEMISRTAPTWCATAPSTHRLILAYADDPGLHWPGLRFLRSSAAPMPADLSAALEHRFGVPVVSAYVMTEAPGEIASQDLDGERRPGTVGRPTLCQVRVGAGARTVPSGQAGEIWIRGPNVVGPGAAGELPWLRTEDMGLLDDAGFLRVTGRSNDVINTGGLKVWPPDVESVILRHPDVTAAVAFPVPHRALGETVGLAVVPRAGSGLDRAAIRRLLRSGLAREKQPSTIVVCAQLPLTKRGKLSRRAMAELLGLEAR
jgi:acyl-CoA synthetase (AMP-forming)/AMP-acid ligase II